MPSVRNTGVACIVGGSHRTHCSPDVMLATVLYSALALVAWCLLFSVLNFCNHALAGPNSVVGIPIDPSVVDFSMMCTWYS